MKEEMKEDMDPHNGADDGKCGARPVPPLGPSQGAAQAPGTRPPPGRASSHGAAQAPPCVSSPLQPQLLCLVQQLRGSFHPLGQEPSRARTSCG